MKSDILINHSSDLCQIDIEGTIGVPEEWQFEEPEARVATYERFRETLQRIAAIDAPEVVVNIRSTGGDVNDALLIHDALRQLPGRITTRCYGYTASAATIIAQAASEGCREISENALYLIHTAICSAEGNAAEMAGKIELLRQTDARIAGVYAARSGRPVGEFEALMAENNGNGRWLSPEETLSAGLADRIIDPAAPRNESLARNLARGWEMLLARMGLKKTAPGEVDRNILHFDTPGSAGGPGGVGGSGSVGPQSLQRPSIAVEVARSKAVPSRTKSCEDPSYGDTIRSANEHAYAEDVRRLRKNE